MAVGDHPEAQKVSGSWKQLGGGWCEDRGGWGAIGESMGAVGLVVNSAVADCLGSILSGIFPALPYQSHLVCLTPTAPSLACVV